jgi:hypothetical protein
MIVLGLVFALMAGAPPKGASADSPTPVQERARAAYQEHQQAALRINQMAGQIHTPTDADVLVSEIVVLFAKDLPSSWSLPVVRRRIARAEYEATRNPARLVSEQRVVDVWNRYVREIGAPEEAVATVEEIHNLRDGELTAAQLMWVRGNQNIWTVPGLYALGPDGKVADGCRAIEAVRVLYDLDALFQNLRGARDRVQRKVVPSDELGKRVADPNQHARWITRLEVRNDINPVGPAERRYVQEHGSPAYAQLLAGLFDELFPPE